MIQWPAVRRVTVLSVCLLIIFCLKGIGLSSDYYVVINTVKTYGVEFNTGNIRFD